ncbi:MAG TPA: hypothetical protein VF008_00905, partial [Niastella sp.]
MEWKYRKDFQVMPGIYLKYGNGGIQTQIRHIEAISDKDFVADKLRHQLFKPYELQHEIKSASIDKLTSCELHDFKSLLFASDKTFNETSSLLNSKTILLNNHSQKLDSLKRSLFKFLFKKRILRMEQELPLLSEEVNELIEQLNYSSIKLEIDSENSFSDLYKSVMKAFNLLNGAQKKWDFTSTRQTNRVAERTSAANTITRSEISISEKHLPILRADLPALCFHNINGGDLYLYPGFLLVYESKEDFAVISYADLKISFNQVRFIESEQVPTDTKIVDKTWFKVNKDGSPDKRFSNNYQIPI